MWAAIAHSISVASGHPFQSLRHHSVGGGCINRAYRLDGRMAGKEVTFFVKTNRADLLPMLMAEADGLHELGRVQAIRVPYPLCYGAAAKAYLVIEYIELGSPSASSSRQLGEQLAAMHHHRSGQFGWFRDNTIGSTPQLNAQAGHWPDFFRQQRLAFQLSCAAEHGYGRRLQHKGEALLAVIDRFFDTYLPQPSLLHGDLWGGNVGFDHHGAPVIFDPAVYYGDRETDLAMTELFGGFDSQFYAAYQDAYPLDDGYPHRRRLYNLYHILNHANLFGGGYVRQAEDMMDQLLAEV
ncbi:fructosamine kinase family protein [Mariprofundus erugo]|uniref:Fructosamine kinase family protein n=1 Tax=Mariprofundus erugo TaxID=2528639 RepID=A0A5R9GSG3_9PROT|nr:fructosamine kinase family protein [Mariprofundus erugo]TLS67879.1 fructosamine kinase family protein [Mariprofundus erugo]